MADQKQQDVLNFKPAVFLHIQKTAGTTIVDLARSFYGNDNVISHGDYFEGLGYPPIAPDEFFQAEYMKSKFGHISFISGHFGYDFAKQFMQDRYSFTFLRNPIERVLSFCFFCKTRDPNEFETYELSQKLSLDEFLKLGFSDPLIKGHIWNHQVSQIAQGFGSLESLELTDRNLLKVAIQHLDKFSYIGFAETFEKDRDNILKDLGITPPQDKIVINANPDRPTFNDLPQSSKDLLLKLTELDRILYKKAWYRQNSILGKFIKKWWRV